MENKKEELMRRFDELASFVGTINQSDLSCVIMAIVKSDDNISGGEMITGTNLERLGMLDFIEDRARKYKECILRGSKTISAVEMNGR